MMMRLVGMVFVGKCFSVRTMLESDELDISVESMHNQGCPLSITVVEKMAKKRRLLHTGRQFGVHVRRLCPHFDFDRCKLLNTLVGMFLQLACLYAKPVPID